MQYQVFQLGNASFEAVKTGWSWPAFFFTWLWALTKQLWAQFAVVFGCAFVLGVIEGVNQDSMAGLWIALSLLSAMFFGAAGNDWRVQNLIARGYRKVGIVDSLSPEAAVQAYAGGTTVVAHSAEVLPSTSLPVDSAVPTLTDEVEESLYERVAKELREEGPKEGLWLKALTEMNGDEAKTKPYYVRLRIRQILREEGGGKEQVGELAGPSDANSLDLVDCTRKLQWNSECSFDERVDFAVRASAILLDDRDSLLTQPIRVQITDIRAKLEESKMQIADALNQRDEKALVSARRRATEAVIALKELKNWP